MRGPILRQAVPGATRRRNASLARLSLAIVVVAIIAIFHAYFAPRVWGNPANAIPMLGPPLVAAMLLMRRWPGRIGAFVALLLLYLAVWTFAFFAIFHYDYDAGGAGRAFQPAIPYMHQP